ncbi:MAG TPA: hypothetical protein VIJ82_27990 [Streptosporangiaceae bacterium]
MTGEEGLRSRRQPGRNSRPETADGLPNLQEAEVRLRAATGLPELLSAGFDAFEVIRVLARSCEDRAPELFAAFMTTADAAVDGREAITASPALPSAPGSATAATAAAAPPDQVTASLAALAGLLSERLALAADLAAEPGDRSACQEAGRAARRIGGLMGRGAL